MVGCRWSFIALPPRGSLKSWEGDRGVAGDAAVSAAEGIPSFPFPFSPSSRPARRFRCVCEHTESVRFVAMAVYWKMHGGIGGRLPVVVHCAASSGLAQIMGGRQRGCGRRRGLRRRRHPVVPVSLLALFTACTPLPLCVRTHGICRFRRNGRVLENARTSRATPSASPAGLHNASGPDCPTPCARSTLRRRSLTQVPEYRRFESRRTLECSAKAFPVPDNSLPYITFPDHHSS